MTVQVGTVTLPGIGTVSGTVVGGGMLAASNHIFINEGGYMMDHLIYKKSFLIISIVLQIIALWMVSMAKIPLLKWMIMAMPIYLGYAFYIVKFIQHHNRKK